VNEYGVDLARIHHQGHGELARSAGPAVVTHLRQAGIREGLVVDLGCGSGILARHLVDSGYAVLGVDPSAAMLRLARRMAPAARFVRSRAEDVNLPKCVAVLATGESLTYLTRRAPTAHLRRHVRRVSAALVPGGLFIFDAITESDVAPMNYRTWRATRGWAVLADVTEDRRRHVVRRRIITFARVGSTYRRSYAEHRVGVYARGTVLRELRRRGFIARTLAGYGASPLAPRRVVFYARCAGH
jgi:SAM-dependent methyltransferase